MGCGGSKEAGTEQVVFFRKPKVSIRIGYEVKVLERLPRVIFIFGGPGSRKGIVMNNLLQMYGFHLVNVESLIVKILSKKLATVPKHDATFAVQELLKMSPDLLSLDMVTREISRAIDSDITGQFIVDFMPNLKSFLKHQSLIKECAAEFGMLEEKYPISFALNLAIPADKVAKRSQTARKMRSTSDKKNAAQQGQKSDEADSSRTQKRALLYENSVKHFLEYFENSDRLVTVDVSSGVKEIIWDRVSEFLTELTFPHKTVENSVIVFAFDEQEINSIDLDRYGMKTITLKDLVDDPQQEAVEKLLATVCKEIDKSEITTHAFLVDLRGTALTKDCSSKFGKRTICFSDVNEVHLDKYTSQQNSGTICPELFKATMCTDSEVCLFNPATDIVLCNQIAQAIYDIRGK